MGMLEEIALTITAGSGVIPTKYGDLLAEPFTGTWAVTMGTMPAQPDQCIALLELPGSAPDETFRPLPTGENQILQVLVRHPSFTSAQNTARALWADLHQLVEVTLSGTRYHAVRASQSPYLMERDDNRRCVFVCNYAVKRRVA